MATILITGGAGFLGSHLADLYAKQGDRVIIIDHHKRDKLRFIPERAEVYKLDFSDPKVHEIIHESRPDVVVHLAAQISVSHSLAHPVEDAERNIIASLKLLEWCKEVGVGKFVFASSAGAIYGDHSILPTPLVHDSRPLSPYGIAKLTFEHYLHSAQITHGLPWTSVRFSNLYGPRQQVAKPIGEGNVISLFLDKLLVTGEPFTVFGDGSATRDYLYADDAVNVLVAAAASGYSGVVNAGTGTELSVLKLIESLERIHDRKHLAVHAPKRVGEVERSSIDPASAKEVLGWEPQISFVQGLKQTYDWYKTTFGR
jgi:UDP-glucose 4-epimerase